MNAIYNCLDTEMNTTGAIEKANLFSKAFENDFKVRFKTFPCQLWKIQFAEGHQR